MTKITKTLTIVAVAAVTSSALTAGATALKMNGSGSDGASIPEPQNTSHPSADEDKVDSLRDEYEKLRDHETLDREKEAVWSEETNAKRSRAEELQKEDERLDGEMLERAEVEAKKAMAEAISEANAKEAKAKAEAKANEARAGLAQSKQRFAADVYTTQQKLNQKLRDVEKRASETSNIFAKTLIQSRLGNLKQIIADASDEAQDTNRVWELPEVKNAIKRHPTFKDELWTALKHVQEYPSSRPVLFGSRFPVPVRWFGGLLDSKAWNHDVDSKAWDSVFRELDFFGKFNRECEAPFDKFEMLGKFEGADNMLQGKYDKLKETFRKYSQIKSSKIQESKFK